MELILAVAVGWILGWLLIRSMPRRWSARGRMQILREQVQDEALASYVKTTRPDLVDQLPAKHRPPEPWGLRQYLGLFVLGVIALLWLMNHIT